MSIETPPCILHYFFLVSDNWLKSLPDTLSRENSIDPNQTISDNKQLIKTNNNNEVEINEIEDIEEESSGCVQDYSRGIRVLKNHVNGSPISLETARELKTILFGKTNSMFPPGPSRLSLVTNISEVR